MSDKGISKLANVLHERVSNMGDASYGSLTLDFGTIQNDYSLLTNTYPIAIPRSDYLVLRQLTLGATGDTLTETSEDGEHEHTSGDGSHTHDGGEHGGHEDDEDGSHTHDGGSHSHGAAGSHTHEITIPEKMRWLLPGDRVLVAWVQNDAVVIDIIYPATAIG